MNPDMVRRLSSEQIERMIDNIAKRVASWGVGAREIETLLADQRCLMQERDRRTEAKWPRRATKSP